MDRDVREQFDNLIGTDIIEAIRCIYEADKDETLLAMAQNLIQEEKDEK